MIEFFQTKMGHIFFEGTIPRLVKALERIADSLEPHPDSVIPYVPTPTPTLWDNNEIQFARLLCEIRAACEMEGYDQVMESMNLVDEQMDELWQRAEAVWEKSKTDHCPPKVQP